MTKQERELKQGLMSLVHFIALFTQAMDGQMKRPPTYQRGRDVANLMNQLTVKNQGAMHFGLGYSFKKIHALYGIKDDRRKA